MEYLTANLWINNKVQLKAIRIIGGVFAYNFLHQDNSICFT